MLLIAHTAGTVTKVLYRGKSRSIYWERKRGSYWLHLLVIVRIEVQIMKDDRVGSCQIDAEAA
jgi:hypothetical protein